MTTFRTIIFCIAFIVCAFANSSAQEPDSIAVSDSALIATLTTQLQAARDSEAALRVEIEHLSSQSVADSVQRARLRARIDSIKQTSVGALVITDNDTLFAIYAKQGGLAPRERAEMVSRKIESLGKSFGFEPDSVQVVPTEFEADIVYQDQIIISLTQLDGLWANCERDSLAQSTRQVIVDELKVLRERHGLAQLIRRIIEFLGILLGLTVIFKLIGRGYRYLVARINKLKETRLRPIFVQNVELLTVNKQIRLMIIGAKTLRIVLCLTVLVLTVPLIFSIFPQTKDLASQIFGYIWNPFYTIIKEIVAYIPNLFTIFVIYIVIRYLVKLLKYLANEMAHERLRIAGFFPDWAMPTFYIIRFLLYAFMIAMIYPYLPGSNSGVFQGISVFVGLIVSLGSSSIIGNLMAGLVITYMRPFKMGDRIEIKDVTGDVIEKTPFVTRIRTPKNEVVTMPNSFIMSSQTVNFSQSAREYGLIIHTDVTMGYEVPWRKINQLLIDAALNTPGVVDDPRPFVLQTNLGDHYTVYQLNAYIRDANLLPDIYSTLHENIQDYFNREGLELLSPHYISARDGNKSTVCPNT